MSRETILPPEEVVVDKPGTKTTVSTSHGMYGSGEGNTNKHHYAGIHTPKGKK